MSQNEHVPPAGNADGAEPETLYAALTALAAENFPKHCGVCGRHYENLGDYLAQTRPVAPRRSGLKESVDEQGRVIVEVFRNCVCGSTLMDFCADRRDHSSAGMRRRKEFDRLIDRLENHGIERERERERAREALLTVLRGGHSALVNELLQGRY